MSFDVTTLLGFHVVVSLVGIATGLVVLVGTHRQQEARGVDTDIPGHDAGHQRHRLPFPVQQILPSHIVGAISIVVLALAIVARYGRHLAGSWRWIYVVTAVTALYLNVFVLVVQLFLKVEALAVTRAERRQDPPFIIAQSVDAGAVRHRRYRERSQVSLALGEASEADCWLGRG